MFQVQIGFERCKECGYCVNFCPKKILTNGHKVNMGGYFPPKVIDTNSCIGCGICAKVCPDAAIEVYEI